MLVHLDRICDFVDEMLLSDQQPFPSDSSEPKPFQQLPQTDHDMRASPQPQSMILIHSDLGISRSAIAAAVTAHLMRSQHRARDDVLAAARARWSRAKPSANLLWSSSRSWSRSSSRSGRTRRRRDGKREYAAYSSGERRAVGLKWKGWKGDEPLRLLELERDVN